MISSLWKFLDNIRYIGQDWIVRLRFLQDRLKDVPIHLGALTGIELFLV